MTRSHSRRTGAAVARQHTERPHLGLHLVAAGHGANQGLAATLKLRAPTLATPGLACGRSPKDGIRQPAQEVEGRRWCAGQRGSTRRTRLGRRLALQKSPARGAPPLIGRVAGELVQADGIGGADGGVQRGWRCWWQHRWQCRRSPDVCSLSRFPLIARLPTPTGRQPSPATLLFRDSPGRKKGRVRAVSIPLGCCVAREALQDWPACCPLPARGHAGAAQMSGGRDSHHSTATPQMHAA